MQAGGLTQRSSRAPLASVRTRSPEPWSACRRAGLTQRGSRASLADAGAQPSARAYAGAAYGAGDSASGAGDSAYAQPSQVPATPRSPCRSDETLVVVLGYIPRTAGVPGWPRTGSTATVGPKLRQMQSYMHAGQSSTQPISTK